MSLFGALDLMRALDAIHTGFVFIVVGIAITVAAAAFPDEGSELAQRYLTPPERRVIALIGQAEVIVGLAWPVVWLGLTPTLRFLGAGEGLSTHWITALVYLAGACSGC